MQPDSSERRQTHTRTHDKQTIYNILCICIGKRSTRAAKVKTKRKIKRCEYKWIVSTTCIWIVIAFFFFIIVFVSLFAVQRMIACLRVWCERGAQLKTTTFVPYFFGHLEWTLVFLSIWSHWRRDEDLMNKKKSKIERKMQMDHSFFFSLTKAISRPIAAHVPNHWINCSSLRCQSKWHLNCWIVDKNRPHTEKATHDNRQRCALMRLSIKQNYSIFLSRVPVPACACRHCRCFDWHSFIILFMHWIWFGAYWYTTQSNTC